MHNAIAAFSKYADILKTIVETPESRIDVMTDTALQKRLHDNRHIMYQIVRAVLYLAKQGLPFRGDNEDISLQKNPGNFLPLLKMFAESDELLYGHLDNPRAKTQLICPQDHKMRSLMSLDMTSF